jgi:hypothetical protein
MLGSISAIGVVALHLESTKGSAFYPFACPGLKQRRTTHKSHILFS